MRWAEIIKVTENASCGATGSASVATAVGALGANSLGAGFNTNGDQGIYQKKKATKPVVLRR